MKRIKNISKIPVSLDGKKILPGQEESVQEGDHLAKFVNNKMIIEVEEIVIRKPLKKEIKKEEKESLDEINMEDN